MLFQQGGLRNLSKLLIALPQFLFLHVKRSCSLGLEQKLDTSLLLADQVGEAGDYVLVVVVSSTSLLSNSSGCQRHLLALFSGISNHNNFRPLFSFHIHVYTQNKR